VSPESYFRGPAACAVLFRTGGPPGGRHSASGSRTAAAPAGVSGEP
jgi:hypothetical protein